MNKVRSYGILFNKIILFFIIFLSLVILNDLTICYAKIVDRIVAVVNGEPITLYELEQRAKPFLDKYLKGIKDPKIRAEKRQEILNQVLPQMIDETLVDQEVKKRGLKVTDQEINDAIKQILKRNNLTLEQFKKILASSGSSFKEYKGELAKELLRLQLIQSEVKSKIVITDEQINNYIKSHPDILKNLPNKPQYVLQYICFTPLDPKDPASVRLAKQKAEQAFLDLKKGIDFSKLLKLYHCKDCKVEGGSLGSFTLDEMANSIKEAVKRLKPGEYTPVIRTPIGWEIFRVKAIINTKKQALLIEKEKIRQLLYKKEVDKRFKKWLKDLREKSSIRILL